MGDIDILIEADFWDTVPGIESVVETAAQTALAGEKAGEASVSILLTDNDAIQALNAQYRSKNKPTNVLSFPAPMMPGQMERTLGDIALAFETCRDEAEAEGKAFSHHVSHLVIHGVLHLLGHDHETEAEAELMEGREIALLASLGIDNPYAERPEARA